MFWEREHKKCFAMQTQTETLKKHQQKVSFRSLKMLYFTQAWPPHTNNHHHFIEKIAPSSNWSLKVKESKREKTEKGFSITIAYSFHLPNEAIQLDWSRIEISTYLIYWIFMKFWVEDIFDRINGTSIIRLLHPSIRSSLSIVSWWQKCLIFGF